MRHATIVGTGSYAPSKIMTNEDLTRIVETSDEWIVSRTGIKERRISSGELTSDLAYEAAFRALESSKVKADEIDLIICATITPDYVMPSLACVVQDKLGARNAVAFDVAAACTGMIYAMVTATSFIQSGIYDKILVIGAETLSKATDWEDRSTCVLFGDGAGAVLLVADEDRKDIQGFHLITDGSKQSLLTLEGLPLSNPYCKVDETKRSKINMQGQEVFKFAVRSITENINKVLEKTNNSVDDIKYIIPHQANYRIIEHAAKSCNIPLEKFYMNLDLYGNTSAASIGIAFDIMVQNNLLQKGDKIILVGFGGGMTSGAILLEWNNK